MPEYRMVVADSGGKTHEITVTNPEQLRTIADRLPSGAEIVTVDQQSDGGEWEHFDIYSWLNYYDS